MMRYLLMVSLVLAGALAGAAAASDPRDCIFEADRDGTTSRRPEAEDAIGNFVTQFRGLDQNYEAP